MAESQGNSFIPKRPSKGAIKTSGIRKIYLLAYVSYILFFCALITTAVVYFYRWSLNNQLETAKTDLAQQRNAFSESDMARVQELDQRIKEATSLVNGHVDVTSIFTALEQSTIDPVTLTSFDYERLAGGNPTVSVSAKADTFDAVLFQTNVLKQNPNMALSNFTMTDPSLHTVNGMDNGGSPVTAQTISFSMGAQIDPTQIPQEGVQSAVEQQDGMSVQQLAASTTQATTTQASSTNAQSQ